MIGLVALGLVVLAGNSPAAAGAPAFEAGIARPAGDAVFRAIALHYPNEYRALADSLDRQAAAHPGDADALNAFRRRALARFYKGRLDDLMNAPASALNAINTRQLALARSLARDDAALCAEYATTGFIGRFDLPAAYQGRASALGALMIEAAKLGAGRPRDPRRRTLNGEDAASWYASLLLVEPSKEVQAAVAGDDAAKVETAEMQCRVGVATYAAIDRLTPEQAANIAAFFLAQSFADLGAD